MKRRPGRPAKLKDPVAVMVWLERSAVEKIDERGVSRSAFVRFAVDMLLQDEKVLELLREVERLREKVRDLEIRLSIRERQVEELRRR